MRAGSSFVFAMFILVGCGKKGAPQAAADSGPAFTVEMPEGADARSYAKGVVGLTIVNWSPIGNSDFKWKSAAFAPDGGFSAVAWLTVGGEELDCEESGTWKVNSVDSSAQGTIEWTIDDTDCPNRDNGTQQRAQIIVEKGDYKISMR
ncbi:MAG: hypothetical protein HN348_28605 [Proteobacteria bacterium]|nr:hypothetical protein [Pseudomonadota bacterium]